MKKKNGFITNTAITVASLFLILGTKTYGNLFNLKSNNTSTKSLIEDVKFALEDYYANNSEYPASKNMEDFKSKIGNYLDNDFPKYGDGTDIIKNYTPVEDSKNKTYQNYIIELNDDKATTNIDESKFKITLDSELSNYFEEPSLNALESTKDTIGDVLSSLDCYHDYIDKYPDVKSLDELEKEVNDIIEEDYDALHMPKYKNGKSIIN
jgi:hypothetical protein